LALDKRGMIDDSHLEPIRLRQAQVEKRRADLDARVAKIAREKAALDEEAKALETTLQTLAKVYGLDTEEGAAIKPATSSKPEGTPTLFEMVSQILTDAAEWGDHLVEGELLYDQIKKRFWPDAPRNSIIPSLWRFWKEGRIVKEGTKYGLLKEETPGASTPSASKLEVDLDDEIPF
jgi:hypothetical protein